VSTAGTLNDMGEWEVERIEDIKRIKGVTYYLLKWKGFSASENTWEPETNLADCTQLLAEFEERKQRLQNNLKLTGKRTACKAKRKNVKKRRSNRGIPALDEDEYEERLNSDSEYLPLAQVFMRDRKIPFKKKGTLLIEEMELAKQNKTELVQMNSFNQENAHILVQLSSRKASEGSGYEMMTRRVQIDSPTESVPVLEDMGALLDGDPWSTTASTIAPKVGESIRFETDRNYSLLQIPSNYANDLLSLEKDEIQTDLTRPLVKSKLIDTSSLKSCLQPAEKTPPVKKKISSFKDENETVLMTYSDFDAPKFQNPPDSECRKKYREKINNSRKKTSVVRPWGI